MKRMLFCLLILVLVISFTSCGENIGGDNEVNEIHSETEANSETIASEEGTICGINVEDYYKVVQFDLPKGSFRDAVVEHMREQATIEWVCSKTFGITEDFNSWEYTLSLKKDRNT